MKLPDLKIVIDGNGALVVAAFGVYVVQGSYPAVLAFGVAVAAHCLRAVFKNQELEAELKAAKNEVAKYKNRTGL